MSSSQNALIRDRLAEVVSDAVERAQNAGYLPHVALPDISIERPAKPEQGDFATNFALRAQKVVGSRGPKPMDIAAAISAQIAQDPPEFLAGFGPAAPGFLNFTLADDWLRRQVDEILALGSAFGNVAPPNSGGRVQVEFVSANPTGPVHVGTGRNAALGDSIARILARTGWQVQREYYYNDAGAQMEHLAHSVWKRYQQLLGKSVELGENDYQGEYIIELAQEIQSEHGSAYADVTEEQSQELGALAAKKIMGWIERDLTKARIRFDNWFSEADLIRTGDFQRLLDLLQSLDLLYEREGAQWLRSQDLGDERDRVLIRSDGRPTYTATDLAYHYDKFLVRKFDRVIDVWGADHQGQVPSMKAIMVKLGVEPARFEIVLYQMINVLEHGRVIRMGKRTGNLVTLAEVMDRVGVDATRWFLVHRTADSMMDFDLDLASKQSSENPVYYVQYAHARLARVLADADGEWMTSGDVQLLTHPSELSLVRRMLQWPEVVELAARNLAPHHIPYYAYELARATQAWYDAGNDDRALRILSEDAELRAARLRLAGAARQVLANALDTIGVVAPDAM